MIIVHVNKQIIARNRKDGKNRPMYRVQYPDGRTVYAREVTVLGSSKFVEGPRLKCGARAYLTTESDVLLSGACTYQEIEP